MEEKINIAAILNDKPNGLRLYSPIFGECAFCYVREDTNDICVKKRNGVIEYFNSEGLYFALGEVMLFPSKSMRDWEKFSWKNGDVLKNAAYEERVIFDGFLNDDYTYFKGKHPLDCSDKFNISYHEECSCFTGNYRLESTDAAQTYINTIEEKLGGKLNRETLEIEKAHHEFKDGDIITFKDRIIIIYNTSIERSPKRTEIYYHACLKEGELTVNEYLMSCGFGEGWYSSTEEEKHNLFEALAKKGKAWDTEKKMIVNLKPKCEFKPFDKVLCRNSKDDTWEADFFARLARKEIDYTQSGKYLCVGDLWMYCIPYNEETAHLLGTTDEWKGGEG